MWTQHGTGDAAMGDLSDHSTVIVNC